MKSLEERLKYRAKQKAEHEKEKVSPTIQNSGVKVEEKTFNAADWLDDGAKNVNGSLTDLNDDELTQLEEAEAKGKKRQSVLASIKKEKDNRSAKLTGWSGNNAA